MNVLFACAYVPYPPDTGGRTRAYHTLCHLSSRHRVHLLAFYHHPDEIQHRDVLASLCETATLLPAPSWPLGPLARLRRALCAPADVILPRRSQALLEALPRLVAECKIDLVHLEELGWDRVARALGDTPTVLVKQNIETQMWTSLAANKRRGTPGRLLTTLEAWALRRWEGRVAGRFHRVTVVSEYDRTTLAALGCPRERVAVVPNGVDTGYFTPMAAADPAGTPRLAFTGALFWYPNVDAVCWMVNRVWPRVRVQEPTVELWLVGRDPAASVQALAAAPGVAVTGTVPDVRPYLAAAAVVVVPARVRGGTRLKVLEALAMGKAVVSTSIGVEGLDLVPGRDLVVADGTEAFADASVALLRDPARRAALGAAGRAAVAARYDWKMVLLALEGVYREALGL